MNFDNLSKEQKIMVSMRKVLSNIIREITPAHRDDEYPLTEQTVEDIRMCLALIAAREKELAEQQGITNKDRPHFTDEPQTAKTVSLEQIRRQKQDN
ncbi:conserved hypothetical protein [Beggiatoa sp. PS]|nr:conserved hypothetical protein [Beggiatoa sp. PS]